MHPEIRQPGPGSCPICGMALEPEQATADAAPNEELRDMTRRFWIGFALALPVFGLEMAGHVLNLHEVLQRPDVDLDPVRARDARRLMGGLAVLRPRGAIGRRPATSTCSR